MRILIAAILALGFTASAAMACPAHDHGKDQTVQKPVTTVGS